MIDLAKLYESVFSDGNCGAAHKEIRDLYMTAVLQFRHGGCIEEAFAYFKKAFEHHEALKSVTSPSEYQYTAPLVSKVTVKAENMPSANDAYWKKHREFIPEKLMERIKVDPQFSECFAE